MLALELYIEVFTKFSCCWQDTINKGRRGTKEKCLVMTEAAVAKGSSVVIDRTNVTVDQRQPFLALAARLGALAHAVSSFAVVFSCMMYDVTHSVLRVFETDELTNDLGFGTTCAWQIWCPYCDQCWQEAVSLFDIR